MTMMIMMMTRIPLWLILSPDDECYELDKPEHRTKPVQRTKSAPTPTTPTTPRSQRIANSFAVEKAQVKLNKLAAMENNN